MENSEIKRKYNVEKQSFPVDGNEYTAQVFLSVDGGENFYYCGIGKSCKTEQECWEYVKKYETEHSEKNEAAFKLLFADGNVDRGTMAMWVEFPTAQKELQKVFDLIGEDWVIADCACNIDKLNPLLKGNKNLDELNYLAIKLDRLSNEEYIRLLAVMEGDTASNISDTINLIDNLGHYTFLPGILNEESLGRYYAGDTIDQLPPEMRMCFDYKAYGRQIVKEGFFTKHGYMHCGGSEIRYYDGNPENIPEEYRVMNNPESQEAETMSVLVVEPGKVPYAKIIDKGLKALQTEVQGHIEAVYPFDDPVALICNEDGKFNGMKLNRALTDENGNVYDIVYGPFLIAGLGEDDFASLSRELSEKYMERFKMPEMFVNVNGTICAVPMPQEGSCNMMEEPKLYLDEDVSAEESFGQNMEQSM